MGEGGGGAEKQFMLINTSHCSFIDYYFFFKYYILLFHTIPNYQFKPHAQCTMLWHCSLCSRKPFCEHEMYFLLFFRKRNQCIIDGKVSIRFINWPLMSMVRLWEWNWKYSSEQSHIHRHIHSQIELNQINTHTQTNTNYSHSYILSWK